MNDSIDAADDAGAPGGAACSRRVVLGAGVAALAGSVQRARAAGPPRASQGRSAAPARPGSPAVLAISRAPMSPDGGPAVPSVAVNGSIPGQELRFRQGDLFSVLVENRMEDTPTSVHWHGMLVPSGMDGVPGLSNAPIGPGRMYLYEYPLRQSGTYWYHSHVGFQEQQGLFGALVIEEPEDGLRADHDPVVLLSDWLHTDPEKVFADLRGQGMKGC